jgi:Domain of unknown function (DUF4395)
MMTSSTQTGFGRIFQFGERLPEYDVPVLNEREARAGAGILLIAALVAFMHAWLNGDFSLVRIVVVGFFIDFVVRVLINPKFSPSLVLGRLAVRNQIPEYTGAPQKRFAWSLGLALATLMFYFIVVLGMRGPVTMLGCLVCLILLFFETAFGICLGCMIYNLVSKQPAQLCPGGACLVVEKADIQKTSMAQIAALVLFIAGITGLTTLMPATEALRKPMVASGASQAPVSDAERIRCTVPQFAKAIGHEEKWKLHNNCL